MEKHYKGIVALVGLLLLCMTSSSSNLELPVEGSKFTAHVLDGYLGDKLDNFKTELHRSYESHRHRQRRSATESSVAHWVLDDVIPVNGLHTVHASSVAHFTYKTDEYLIVGAETNDAGDSCRALSTVYLFENDTQSFTDSDLDLTTFCVSDIEPFFIDGSVYLAIAQKKNDAGQFDVESVIYKFDADGPHTFPFVQSVRTNGATDFEFYDHDGTYLLAVTNEQTDRYAKFQTKFEVFQWVGAYFDRIAQATTYAAQDACGFAINGQVYFAVAQYQNNDGSFDVGSMIFQYDEYNVELREFQSVPSTAAMDFEYFELNGNHYLALANYMELRDGALRTDTESVIFWWAGNQFVEYQRILTHGATKIESIPLPNGEVLLAIGNSDNDVGVVIFSMDTNGQFVVTSTNVQGFNPWADMSTHEYPRIDYLQTFTVGSKSYLAVANNNHNETQTGDAVFELDLTTEIALPVSMDPILGCVTEVIQNLQQQVTALSDLAQRLDNRMSVTQVQSIDSPVVFQGNVKTQAKFETAELELEVDNRFDLDPNLPIVSKSELLANLTSAENDISSMMNQTSDVVMVTGEQTITGNVVLNDVTMVTLNVTNLQTSDGLVNGIDLVNINNNAVNAFDPDTIEGAITFHSDLITNFDITVIGFVNGVNVTGNVLLSNGVQTIIGNKTFQDDVEFTANVDATTVNEITISSDVVTQSTDQTIATYKLIDSNVLVNGNLNLADGISIDSVDPSEFKSTVVRLSQPNNINGMIRLNSFSITNNLNVTGDINGVHIETLASDIVYKNGSQIISGEKQFLLDVHATDITGGSINGVDVSEEVVALASSQVISGFLTITGTVFFSGNVVCGDINGLDLSSEVVVKRGAQNITGMKTFFQGFNVGSDIEMYDGATVDGVDLDAFDSTAMKLTQPQTVQGDKTFSNNITVGGNVNLNGTVNGIDLNAVATDVLTKSTDQTITVPLMLFGNFTVTGDMTVTHSIDDYSQDSFININSDGVIQGYKTFSENVEIGGNLNPDADITIDGVDVSDLNSGALHYVGDQTIHNNIVTSGIDVNTMDVSGDINGLNITQDLVFLHGQWHITGQKTFTSPVTITADLTTTTITTSGTINNIDVSDLAANACMNNANLTITGDKTFSDVTVLDSLVINGTVNGVYTSVFDSVATVDGAQDITGEKTFLHDVTFNAAVTVDGLVNSQDLSELTSTIVLLHTSDIITGDKTFWGSSIRITGNLIVKLVNGINLSDLKDNYLSKTIMQTLTGVKTFTQSITLDNLVIDAGFTLDGKDLSTLVLLDSDYTFVEDVVVTNSLHVNGDISVSNGINGIDIVQLNTSILRLHSAKPQVVYGVKRFNKVIVFNNVQIDGLLNTLNISDLTGELVTNTMNPIVIYADTTFTSDVQVEVDINFNSTVNGVDINYLYKDVVTVYEPQTISGVQIFHNVTFITNVEVDQDMTAIFHTQGVDLGDFVDSIVLKSTDQIITGDITFIGSVTFKQDLDVGGTIDSCNISLNVVLKNANRVLTGFNSFNSDITVIGNLQVGILIDGINITAIQEGAVSLSQPQTITGLFTFLHNVTVTGSVDVYGTVNDIDIEMDLVTLNMAQNITGNKTFLQNTEIGGHLESEYINDYSLEWHVNNVVTHDGDHLVSGHKTFNGKVMFQDVILNGLINDVIDPSEMKDYSEEVFSTLTQDIIRANHTFREQCEPVYNLTFSTPGQGIMFSHFEDWQDVYTMGALAFHSVDYRFGTILILTETYQASLSRCAKGHIYMCPEDGSECWKMVESGLPAATSIKGYTLTNDTLLVITYSAQSEACSYSGADDLTEIRNFDSSLSQNVTTNKAQDSVMFTIDNVVYLAIANGNEETDGANIDSQVFSYNEVTGMFTQYQVINTKGATSVAFVDGATKFLVFAESYDSAQKTIEVPITAYQWDAGTSQFSTTGNIMVTKEKTYAASDVISFYINGVTHVAFSSPEMVASKGSDIKIYSYDESGSTWQLVQRIILPNVIDLEVFEAGGTLYLLASDNSHYLHVYQWAIASKFQFYFNIRISGLQSAHSFQHEDDLYIAAAAHVDTSTTLSKIIKAIVKGDRSPLDFLE